MNYHLRTPQGQDLGIHPLEEIRRRRHAGELSGAEFVWCSGMADWALLDTVLQGEVIAAAASNATASAKSTNPWLIFGIVASIVAILGVFLFIGLGVLSYAKRAKRVPRDFTAGLPASPAAAKSRSAVELASQPVVWQTNTLTAEDMRIKQKEFRIRQYLDGYQNFGQRDPATDALALRFLDAWILCHFGTPAEQTNLPSLADLSDQLATNAAVTDPLILTIAAVNAVELHEAIRRLERAVSGFESSSHRAYPKFFATVTLANKLIRDSDNRRPVLDAAALHYLKTAFQDGSLRATDQDEIAEVLIFGWGNDFFERNETSIYSAVGAAGEPFAWLALVLEGQAEIKRAWRARGSGYADAVSDKGWRGFSDHLGKARARLTEAWQLRPELPLAADRMIYVSLGDSDLAEMRQWFDRAVLAQIDYAKAWSDLRWGLRPRWYGDGKAMLAFGLTALQTRRFDTDVPRILFDSVADLEAELELPPGEHIYSRRDIWPNLQAMYEGYLAEPTQAANRDGWRNSYATVAYLAQQYDTAQAQLAALNWQPNRQQLSGWGTDLSLMSLEVAARTGPQAADILDAENLRQRGDFTAAAQSYARLHATPSSDPRTQQFIADRLVTVELERRLASGEWVDFLPTEASWRGWSIERGQAQLQADGSIEIQAGPTGHLLYSRVRMGRDFEVTGEIETVRSTTTAFQGGLVIGLPEPESWSWNAFRLKRNTDEGDLAAYAVGWSKRQIYHPAKLDPRTNSFTFRFSPDRVSATVNGLPSFNQVRPPQNSRLSTNEIYLGLGAFNDMNETVLRYRNVKVRQLAKD